MTQLVAAQITEATLALKRIAGEHGLTIEHYHAANENFNAKLFKTYHQTALKSNWYSLSTKFTAGPTKFTADCKMGKHGKEPDGYDYSPKPEDSTPEAQASQKPCLPKWYHHSMAGNVAYLQAMRQANLMMTVQQYTGFSDDTSWEHQEAGPSCDHQKAVKPICLHLLHTRTSRYIPVPPTCRNSDYSRSCTELATTHNTTACMEHLFNRLHHFRSYVLSL